MFRVPREQKGNGSRKGDSPGYIDIKDVRVVIPFIKKMRVDVRCFECQTLFDGKVCNFLSVWIYLLTIPTDVFDIEVACQNGGNV